MARKKAGLAPPEKPKRVRVSIDSSLPSRTAPAPDDYLVMVEKTIEGEKRLVREGALPEAQSRAGVSSMPVKVQTRRVRLLTDDIYRRRTIGWVYRRTFIFEV